MVKKRTDYEYKSKFYSNMMSFPTDPAERKRLMMTAIPNDYATFKNRKEI